MKARVSRLIAKTLYDQDDDNDESVIHLKLLKARHRRYLCLKVIFPILM